MHHGFQSLGDLLVLLFEGFDFVVSLTYEAKKVLFFFFVLFGVLQEDHAISFQSFDLMEQMTSLLLSEVYLIVEV